MLKIETSGNARKSQWRKRDNKGNFSKSRRGSSKYYCYIQERYSDIYCFIIKSVVYPIPKDNFNKENDKFLGGVIMHCLSDFIPWNQVSVTGDFVGHIQELIRTEVLPYQWEALNDQIAGAELGVDRQIE